jgi:hypothetical protein
LKTSFGYIGGDALQRQRDRTSTGGKGRKKPR